MLTKQEITISVLTILDQYAASGEEVTPSSYFYDLGFDSLDRVEIFIECENKFGVNLHSYDPQRIETVSELINTIYVCLIDEPT